LQWIKWLTVVLALSFAAIAGTFGWLSYELSSSLERSSDFDSFSDHASTLLQEGKETEALALVQEREKKFPKDFYVHWYRGKAYYQLGQFAEALAAIERLHVLAPTWREEYTEPYLKAIKEKMATKR
jgi:tetratricopeptide (TPR) repeat protein